MTAGEWEFPSLNLLSDEKMTIVSDEMELDKKERMIQEKLAEFGIGSDRGPANAGPTVTQFTLKPHEGVKLAKITNLKNDLALALSTPSLRLEAPIPGKDLIGIEIPNEKRATVHLKEILESREFEDIKSPLRLAMGRDVAGNAVVADLAEMPHLLIAGATGAGKSVGMNTFLMSLLFQNSPADLKLIMVDPKRVELMPYNNIPHLLTPVITEAEKALAALRWCVAEMMRRYGELAQKGYRNVAEYNAKEEEKMPKIVIVIDELADLMMRQLKKDTEAAICRLAQMARAVGMHLIVATQRPSVDVITGLIKANIPTRISFAVTSAVDSRTILDSIGAEDLLGKGDMLFSNAALSKPRRIQGIFVSSEEINRVTNKLKIAGQPEYDDSVTAGSEPDESGLPDFSGGGSAGGNINEQAVEVIRSTGKASASLLQRRLSVGYARAARILDELEEQGLIGPARGAKPREIYL
jgi:S-DNA-T family DNA segregation ATPase FtsK/SpoIIIE